MKIILIAFVFIISLAFSLKAENQVGVNKPTNPESKSGMKTSKQIESPWLKLDNQFVTQIMDNMNKLITEGQEDEPDSKIVSESQLKYFSSNLDKLYKHADTEKVTHISRDWYLQLNKIVLDMANCSKEINMATLNIEKNKMKSLCSKYDDLKKVYKKIYDNPERPKK
jgi:hypothetical protein